MDENRTVRQESHTSLVKRDTAVRVGNVGSGGMVTARAMQSVGAYGPYLREDEARAVLDRTDMPIAWQTLLRFLWQAGPRISEALGVTVDDVRFTEGTIRVRTLKRRKRPDGSPNVQYRLVPIQNDLLGLLGRQLAESQPGKGARLWPWTREHASRRIHAMMVAAGIDEDHCHPHAWRHGLAVNCIRQGVPLPLVQDQLGHASLSSTAAYLQMTIADRKEALAKVRF
jgi:integrase/recombinase XerD